MFVDRRLLLVIDEVEVEVEVGAVLVVFLGNTRECS